MLVLCCSILRRRRAMRFRAGAQPNQAGRQIGFMYFPARHEMGHGTTNTTTQPTPGMTEAGHGVGASPYGANTNHTTTAPASGAHTTFGHTAQPQGPAHPEGNLPSPPPVYQKDGQFAPPPGAPPMPVPETANGGYAPVRFYSMMVQGHRY
jgi:hypothetical protein